MLDSKIAAKIAKAAGLTLSDAVALSRLAETAAEAEALASTFAPEDPHRQLAREDLARMSSEQIVAAKAAGQLDTLMGGGQS